MMTPVIATIAAVVNLGLNFWFIPRWGIVGAGLTTVIGYALLLWLGWLNAQRSYPVPYDWRRVGKVAAVVTAYLVASEWVIPDVGVIAVAVRVLLACVFPFVLVAVGGLERGDLRKGREMFLGRLRRRPPAEAAT
jgi:O-antigen/teichoic acid export membrane protein